MRGFQLDECSDDGDFANQCNLEGRCEIRRMPWGLKTKDDTVVLPALLASDAPILSTDHGLVIDHGWCIPPRNPGVIIVKVRPARSGAFEKLVAKFKVKYPAWACTDWSGVYLEIEDKEVYVHRMLDGNVEYDGDTIQFSDNDFAEKLYTIISGLAYS